MSATTLLDDVDAETQKLSRDEQLELARRLLNRLSGGGHPQGKRRITELIGMGKGTWKSAEDVRRYIEEERASWDR